MLFRGFKPSLTAASSHGCGNMVLESCRGFSSGVLDKISATTNTGGKVFVKRSFLWWRIVGLQSSARAGLIQCLVAVAVQLEYGFKTRSWAWCCLTKISHFQHAAFHLEIISFQTVLLRRPNISEVIEIYSMSRKSFETQREFHNMKICLWTIQRQRSELSTPRLQWSVTRSQQCIIARGSECLPCKG